MSMRNHGWPGRVHGWLSRIIERAAGFARRHRLVTLLIVAALAWGAWWLVAPSSPRPASDPAPAQPSTQAPPDAGGGDDTAGQDGTASASDMSALADKARKALADQAALGGTSRSGATLDQWAASTGWQTDESSGLYRADQALTDAAKSVFAAGGDTTVARARELSDGMDSAWKAYPAALWEQAAQGRAMTAFSHAKAQKQMLDAVTKDPSALPQACSKAAGMVDGEPSGATGKDLFDRIDSWASGLDAAFTECSSSMTPEQTESVFGPSATQGGD